ncbi:hypothetical protein E4U61_005155 [Claviceps capensis]|nr:hypothetical protein E4U61_005155 [Claviceps capensis]
MDQQNDIDALRQKFQELERQIQEIKLQIQSRKRQTKKMKLRDRPIKRRIYNELHWGGAQERATGRQEAREGVAANPTERQHNTRGSGADQDAKAADRGDGQNVATHKLLRIPHRIP